MSFNSDFISSYTLNAFREEGQSRDYLIEWYKEINVFEDVCDLEINAVLDNVNTDFDYIIPTVDGIIYFLDPIKDEENQFFEMILPIINSVKRDIPIVIIYNSMDGILPISINELLENLWFKHFNLEAFVNIKPKEFYQALQCLSFAMINGESPLNIENAWMRFPIYIQLGNIFFKKANSEHKSEYFFYAAQNVKKAAMIAEILNKEEYYIISDKAASLFSKVNLYLEASKILNNIDKKKAKNFKKLYADSIIEEGDKLYNAKKFDLAAERYLAAAQWLAIEMNNPELGVETFKLSINSWISAYNLEMAFKVLYSLPHEKILIILDDISEKIEKEVNDLVRIGKLSAARSQLYGAIAVYQKEGLFLLLEKFTYQLEDVLIRLLQIQIEEKERFAGKETVEEIENLWETYNVKKTDLDNLLEKLVLLILGEYDFPTSTILINKIDSLSIRKNLTKLSSKYEEDFKNIKKAEIEENLKKGITELKLYIVEELQIINDINAHVINEANKSIETNDILDAANIIESQVNFLKRIGREEIQNDMLIELLDILLKGKQIKRFISSYEGLKDHSKKQYLIDKFQVIKEKLIEVSKDKLFSEVSSLFDMISTAYRDQMIYDKSKEISKHFIEYIQQEALNRLKNEKNINATNEALRLIKKCNDISLAYLEGEKQNFDQVYQCIIDIYITEGKLAEANSINEKIENKKVKGEIHKKIDKKETEKSAIDIKRIEASLKEEKLKEMYSIIKIKAREAIQLKENELSKRKGLKRAYFDKGLNYLRINDLDAALEEYKISLDRLIRIRADYYLAGVSLAIIYIILGKQHNSSKFNVFLSITKEKLASLVKSFTDTFPVTLIEYIKDIEDLGDKLRLNEVMLFLENLPLFEEEAKLLNSILGKKVDSLYEDKEQKDLSVKFEILKNNISNYINNIDKEKQNTTKRKLLKSEYWKLALEDLANNKLQIALNDYLNTITPLLDKNFYDYAAISLTLSSLITLKMKNVSITKTFLEEKVEIFNQIFPEFGKLTKVLLVKEILDAMEHNHKELTVIGLKCIIEKFVLFNEEIEFIEEILKQFENSIEIESDKGLSREEVAKKQALLIDLEQRYGILSKQTPDLLREKSEIFKKRDILKKRIYNPILTELNLGHFERASELYFDQAISMAKRQDLKTGALLILLHGLCLIKTQVPIIKIKESITNFLATLLNRRLFQDTYYVTCILFIVDVMLNKEEKFLSKIKPLLEVLPLLDEELILIDFF